MYRVVTQRALEGAKVSTSVCDSTTEWLTGFVKIHKQHHNDKGTVIVHNM